MSSVTFTTTTTTLTYAIAPNGDAPLFRFDHTVFQGKAPRDYKVICLANVLVFETSAKVNVIFAKRIHSEHTVSLFLMNFLLALCLEENSSMRES